APAETGRRQNRPGRGERLPAHRRREAVELVRPDSCVVVGSVLPAGTLRRILRNPATANLVTALEGRVTCLIRKHSTAADVPSQQGSSRSLVPTLCVGSPARRGSRWD